MVWVRYNHLLKNRPLLTNAITTGFLFTSGDVIAQTCFESHRYDFKRTLRAAIYGGCIFAFIGDKWYKLLASIKFPARTASLAADSVTRKFLDTTARVAVDQLCWAPVGIPLYYSCMVLMEGGGTADVEDRLRHNWWATLVTNWQVWPAFQFVNFYVVPVQFRLLAVNVVSIAWNCFLSLRNGSKRKEDEKPVHNPPVPV